MAFSFAMHTILAVPAFSRARFFFSKQTATTEIYTLSLHDALPIYAGHVRHHQVDAREFVDQRLGERSEEHTSELQSRREIVCRLLLEKKKNPRLRVILRR